MNLEEKGNLQGRVFISSVKWDKENKSWTDSNRIEKLLNETRGSIEIFTITHKQGTIEEHQHFVFIFKTPRKLKQIAKLLNVENNFVDKAISKKAQLRYLIHLDNPEKEQYESEEVISNTRKNYFEEIWKNELSDNEILNIIEKKGLKELKNLVGIVEITKLNNIIKFYKEIRKL